MATPDRLEFALATADARDWRDFETFVTAFLAEDLRGIRSIGGVGDLGRDAKLFAVDDPGVVFQYSVARDWRDKITRTVARLREADVEFTILVYATSVDVGARGDVLARELRADGIALD